jgi:hypothetical protein
MQKHGSSATNGEAREDWDPKDKVGNGLAAGHVCSPQLCLAQLPSLMTVVAKIPCLTKLPSSYLQLNDTN